MQLDGRVAVVTGSTRGIGRAIAERLLEAGATVYVNGRSEETTRQIAEEISQVYGRRVHSLIGDVSNQATVNQWYSTVFKQEKRLDVLVNNAGVLIDALLGMISNEQIQEVLDTNVKGVILNTQAASRVMARSGGGSIINMSSIVGVLGHEGQVVYSASKASVIGVTYSSAQELAAKNIRVNALAPGLIDTQMLRSIPAEKLTELEGRVRLGRLGTPADIAKAAFFLAGDDSSYITGQVLGVDGGLTF